MKPHSFELLGIMLGLTLIAAVVSWAFFGENTFGPVMIVGFFISLIVSILFGG